MNLLQISSELIVGIGYLVLIFFIIRVALLMDNDELGDDDDQ